MCSQYLNKLLTLNRFKTWLHNVPIILFCLVMDWVMNKTITDDKREIRRASTEQLGYGDLLMKYLCSHSTTPKTSLNCRKTLASFQNRSRSNKYRIHLHRGGDIGHVFGAMMTQYENTDAEMKAKVRRTRWCLQH